MFSTPMKSAGENVKDELITQNTLIGDIAQSLGLTVTEASGNSKNQLQIMNNNLQEIKNGNTNFLPENIKSGVTMWGKTGTFDNSNGKYIWKKCNEYEFIDYVFSDNENKYPDGAVHTDGYYYKRVSEGIDLSLLGFTKWEVGNFILSSSTLETTINHSLNVIPKLILVYCTDDVSAWNIKEVVSHINSKGAGMTSFMLYNKESIVCSGNLTSGLATSTQVKIDAVSTYLFEARKTYNYILLA